MSNRRVMCGVGAICHGHKRDVVTQPMIEMLVFSSKYRILMDLKHQLSINKNFNKILGKINVGDRFYDFFLIYLFLNYLFLVHLLF